LWIGVAAGGFGAITAPLAQLLLANGPKYGISSSELLLPGLVAMTCIMLLLFSLRTAAAARSACLVWPFLLAVVYLIAPLRWAGEDYTRPEIASIAAQIKSGYFTQNEALEMRLTSFFSYIPVYATFGDEYQVEYDSRSRILRMVVKKPPQSD